MKKRMLRLISIVSCLCILLGAIGIDGIFPLMNVSSSGSDENEMTQIEKDFAGYLYDVDSANIGASSVLISDETVKDLQNYESKYKKGNYTSLADYMYSIDDDGNLVRDMDYSASGNKKTGLLYYKEALNEFEISFEYRYTKLKQTGWNGVYIGFGASRKGELWSHSNKNSVIFLQPHDHNVLCGSTTVISAYKSANVNYADALAKRQNDTTGDEWYAFKLRVKDGVANWYVDEKLVATYTPSKYEGGYIYFGTMTGETGFRNISITNLDGYYADMTDIEKDFKAAFYDQAASSIGASSKLVTDENIEDLENYEKKYLTSGVKSLADYLFSIDSEGNLVRDNDTGTSGDKKIGFLYYNKVLDEFSVEFEYRHSMATSATGRKSVYIGYGAQKIGNHLYGDKSSGAIRLQPVEMYSYWGGNLIKNYSNNSDFKTAVADVYNSDLTAGVGSWNKVTLTISENKVTWEINGKTFSEEISGYLGGYVYITAMTKDTAFRNIKVTETKKEIDTSKFSVYYAPSGKRLIDGVAAKKAEFNDCWSLEDGTFTRSGTGEYAAGPNGRNGESLLYFDKKYEAFQIELDYRFGSNKNTWLWAAVGFGADEIGSHYANGDGYLTFIEQEGYIGFHYPNGSGTKSDRILAPSYFTNLYGVNKNQSYYNDVRTASPSAWHHLKIVVKDGVMTVSYDNIPAVQKAVTDYSGYVYLMAFSPEMQYKNVSITELKEQDLTWAEGYEAYYVPNGTDFRTAGVKFTKTDVTNVWGYMDEAIVRAGSGNFAGGPNGVKGQAALYFKNPYTNFVLEYDYSFAGDKSTWRWASAGFGASALGEYYKSDNSYCIFVEKEGYRSCYGNGGGGRISGAGIIQDYWDLVENGDNTWHHFKLVVSGNKAQLYIDNYDVTEVALENYNGGYVSILSNVSGMKYKNISISEISYIKQTDAIEPIIAQSGTVIGALPLPKSVKATLGDDTVKQLDVVEWKCDGYDPNTAGTYIFTGELNLTGSGIYEKDTNRFVRVSVTIADYDTTAVKEFNILSQSQLDQTFISYYAHKDENIDKGAVLKQAEPSKLWAVTSKGGVKRAGQGEYEGTLSGHKAAALLYFKDKYNEFELDFDYCFNGTTQSHKWVGFGVGVQTPGKTPFDGEGNGSLFSIEMEGQIRKLQAGTSPLITAKSAFAGYSQTLTDKTLNLNTWHHVKVAVKNSIIYIFVDDYPVASTALEGYKAGYIHLLGCTKELEFRNIRVSEIKTASVTGEIPYRAVPVGTTAEQIGLPSSLEITVDGKKVQCPVEWSSSDYNSSAEGTYIFYATAVGKYSHYWLSDTSKRVIASVSVGSFDDDVVHKFALNSVEELEAYFTNYYCKTDKQLSEKGEWKPTSAGNNWSISSNGYISRAGTGSYSGGAKGAYGVAALYYNQKLTNFEVELDYRHGTGGWRWFQILGFGAEKIGDNYTNNGYMAYIEREGDITLTGSINGESLNVANPFPSTRFMKDYLDKVQRIWKDSDEWCHIRLSVIDGVMRIYGDDGSLWQAELDESYKGGYIYLLQNSANTAIKNLSITNYDAKNIDIVSMQTAEELGCGYQSIDKTKGDALSFANESVVTDSNGYKYRLPLDWKAPSNYRSGKLGTYTFSGVPVMPSAKFRNPNGIAAAAIVKIAKVDYNTANTIKYYFDHENDLLDFTNYYTEDVMKSDLAANDWREQWMLIDGELRRMDDNFRALSGASKYRTVKKVARLTYNDALKGNWQIDVDYKQDGNTWMWPMICFSIKDKTKFMTDYSASGDEFSKNNVGGTAVYLEREAYVNYWGNMAQPNQDGIRIRATKTSDRFVGYDHTKPHHMKLTFIQGVARVYIDDYETTYAARIPDAALGEFVSIMTNGNAASFDNFAITKLPDNATEGIDIDSDEVSFVIKESNPVTPTVKDVETGTLNIVIAVLVTAVAAGLLAVSGLILIKNKKYERK
ncbi:MAG: DUF1080 domain-containing protein [Ruminococcaceae bacterium]|nr:DUF1080 domain-containing protein [Oscillospiraceae bacterium]